ncbi:MAG: hypothetical protein JWQ97_3870, partial [Phenylobacterium sp.]|nr:hypothetical protein [Phenylobacterium sp.]
VKPGDVISTDAGGMPIYRVVAVENGQALLQSEHDPALRVMPVARFRWKAASTAAAESLAAR